jgi:DNA-binding transcriptional LysR family regulator
MSIRQLEAFAEVAELKGFTAAGERLGLTPSAVSQLVSELESIVGFKLFDRTTRKVALSSAGREFVASAQTALRHMRLAETAASDLRNRSAGVVRVAAPLVVASVILPPLLKAYQQLQPKVVVRIRDCAVDGLVPMVSDGDADLALGPDRVTDENVSRQGLFPSPWVLWCSPEHPLARRKTIRWRELKAHALVAAGRDHELSVTQMREGVPEQDRITPVDVVDNISTALGMAAANLCATLSPAYVAPFATPMRLVMRRVVEPEVMREMSLYRSARRPLSPAAEGVAEFLLEHLRRHVREETVATTATRRQVQKTPAASARRERKHHPIGSEEDDPQ